MSTVSPAGKCPHGYWTHAYVKCPWCVGFSAETADVIPVVGPGNGWLLRHGQAPCMRCGGPGGSGSGLLPDYVTSEWYAEFTKRENLCFGCWRGVRERPLTPLEQSRLVHLTEAVVPPAVRQEATRRAAERPEPLDSFRSDDWPVSGERF